MEILHFADITRKFFTSQNPTQDIGARSEKTEIFNCSPKITDLEKSLASAHIEKNQYTIIRANGHAILIINDGKNFYVFDSNQKVKSQPLVTKKQVATVLYNSFLGLFPPNKNFCFLSQSISFTYSKTVDRYVKAMEKKYVNDPKISSLIAEFKAGQIAYESLKEGIEDKPAPPDFAKKLNLKPSSYVFENNIPSDAAKLLFFLTRGGELKKAEWLLNEIPEKHKNIHINARYDDRGTTPLYCAAQKGHTEVVRLLLENKAAIDQPTNDKTTPLMIAACSGHLETVKLLRQEGANIDLITNDGATPLYFAAQNGHTEVVRFLLENKAGIDQPINDKTTPLMIAAYNGHLEIVELLWQEGASIHSSNDADDTPLIYAASNGHVDVVQFLLEKGAKIDLANKIGATPLYFAAQNGHANVVQLLLEKKAKVDLARNTGATPLLIAAENGYKNIVELLWQEGADIDQPDNTGSTPFYRAAENGHADVVQLLLEKKAKVDLARKTGATPLLIAAKNGHANVVELLLKAGAENKSDDIIAAPLFHAADNGHANVVKLLLNNKAETDLLRTGLPDITITFPFSIAVKKGFADVVKVFLENAFNYSLEKDVRPIVTCLRDLEKTLPQTPNQKEVAGLIKTKIYNEFYNSLRNGPLEKVQLFLNLYDINFAPTPRVDDSSRQGFETPLRIAVLGGRPEIVRLLLQKGANINAHINALTQDNVIKPAETSNHSLLTVAAKTMCDTDQKRKNCKEIIELLLNEYNKGDSKIHFKQKQNDINAAFCAAIRHGNIDAVELLFKAGANIKLAFTSVNKTIAYKDAQVLDHQAIIEFLDQNRPVSFLNSFFQKKPEVQQIKQHPASNQENDNNQNIVESVDPQKSA